MCAPQLVATYKNILLLTDKLSVDNLNVGLVENIKYQQIEQKDKWRISMVKELIEIQQGNTNLSEHYMF